jgi:cell wall-associated NlpC family hydrolase
VTEQLASRRRRPWRLARLGLALLTPLAFAAALVIPGSPAAQAITLNAPMVGITAAANGSGYYLAGGDGGVFSFPNTLPFHGSLAGQQLNAPIVGIVADQATGGYWMVGSDGGVFSFDAPFYGSLGSTHLNAPIVGMAATPDDKGYILVGADGGVFTFGDAVFHGSLGGTQLNAPIVGISVDPSTGGYDLVGSDGGVFTFDAPFYGSMGGQHLNAPVVGIAVDPSTQGYVLAAADGGVFTFNAPFEGSMGGQTLTAPVEGIAYDASTQGYWLGAKDGGVFSFDAPFYGSLGGSTYPVTPPPPTSTAQAIINAAYSQMGVPYVWGDEDPGVGFDCSGLAQWAYAQAGISIPRTTETQWPAMQHVSEAQAVPGDLVFFNTPGDSQAPPNHVGIYLGNGLMIDAPYTGTVVRKDSITSDVLYGFGHIPGV